MFKKNVKYKREAMGMPVFWITLTITLMKQPTLSNTINFTKSN